MLSANVYRPFRQQTSRYKTFTLRGCLYIKLCHCLHDVTITSPCFVPNKRLLYKSFYSSDAVGRKKHEAKCHKVYLGVCNTDSLCSKFCPAAETSGVGETNNNLQFDLQCLHRLSFFQVRSPPADVILPYNVNIL